MEVVRFYRVDDKYGYFSNFSPHPIKMKGKIWPTSEHYFQAQKFAGTEHEEEIRLVRSPMIAARMGRDRKRPLRHDWESVKDEIMFEAVRAKFTQYEEFCWRQEMRKSSSTPAKTTIGVTEGMEADGTCSAKP
jgi:ribA/ribD-fused uncharacterized protein